MSYQLLIVDDSATARAMTKRAIGKANIAVARIFEVDNGREAVEFLADHPVDLVLAELNTPEMDGVEMIGRLLAGETDAVYILYSRFRSALSQVPTLEKVLPVALPETGDAETPSQVEYLYEPGAQRLLESLLPQVTAVAVQRALLEATASEHGARMTAMDSASSNAAKMIGSLTLQMNRARQASITRELMEIVGTAEALK